MRIAPPRRNDQHRSGMHAPCPIPDNDERKELVRLCRAGRLYELEEWISDGKPLDISSSTKRGRQKRLLEIAVNVGLHSLVELIAKHDPSQSSKDAALAHAVSNRRLDLAEVLLANGADPKSVPLADVLVTWEPQITRFVLDHGADSVSGRPFAEAFGAKVRTALRAFVEYKRTHSELAPQLQEQLDCALRHFCYEGDLKWMSLLLWAGGDPRSRGPCLYKEYTEDPECYTSAMEEATQLRQDIQEEEKKLEQLNKSVDDWERAERCGSGKRLVVFQGGPAPSSAPVGLDARAPNQFPGLASADHSMASKPGVWEEIVLWNSSDQHDTDDASHRLL